MLIAAALFLVGVAVRQTAPDWTLDRRALLALEEEWRVAQQRNDTAAFKRLLAPDLTFIGTSGSFRNRAGYVAGPGSSWIPRVRRCLMRPPNEVVECDEPAGRGAAIPPLLLRLSSAAARTPACGVTRSR